MNLFDSSFLTLDIGTTNVRGIAHRVKSGRITQSAFAQCDAADTAFAIKSVVDDLEKQIGARFDSGFVTGNFGDAQFSMHHKADAWPTAHKITPRDIAAQISQITPPDGFHPIHIVPMRYDTPAARNIATPVGFTDRGLSSLYGVIFYSDAHNREIVANLRRAHIMANGFYDPAFLVDSAARDGNETAMLIDLGGESTTISIWSGRGPVFFEKIEMGQNEITKKIAKSLHLDDADAERIKRGCSDMNTTDMDRFTPADSAYDFSRGDVNDIVIDSVTKIIDAAYTAVAPQLAKYKPSKILVYGGGSDVAGIDTALENIFNIPVKNLGADAAVRALSTRVWQDQTTRIGAYLARRTRWQNFVSRLRPKIKKHKKKIKFIPIMPSTLAFDMTNRDTYSLFQSGGISMVHVDIMDGFFVDKITGGVSELKFIRENTNAHLHVHLMTESPAVWATGAANAGADTIIVSTNTAGVRAALRKIRNMKKRCGIALNPESGVEILKPVLKEIDEVLIMSVKPGAGGQTFDDNVLHKIAVLANTRKRYGLKFKISVDGGINPITAQKCWAAGADFLISGSYLASAHDFPLAVQSLLPNPAPSI